ncbi:hypothetical protein IDJ77_23135 [Mucilaginibacter sp. ZT4R22]|uniref:Uncharacterized protein n=1 Tax=Mucilaginibacter pankratovii TaxID=2772110 RepID=A0ABR7WWR2_9SPHI|nr:hypothetical protein [Mucilaginibacter pankratovii]MBD1366725.1 hypothetical protein [Mucilaginibacter pankratovii]
MKQQEVFKKIGVIIQEINEQYEYLQGTVENLNDLELELFVANTHFLKDHAEILRKLNAIKSQPIAKSSIKDEPKWFEPVVQPVKPAGAPFKLDTPKPAHNDSIKFEIVQPEEELQLEQAEPLEEPAPSIDLSNDTPADTFSFEREEPETVRHELVLDEADNFEDEEDGQSQDETLLTPIAEIEAEAEVENPEPEEEDPKTDAEPEVVEETPEAEKAPEVKEIPEPVAEAPELEPEIEAEEEETQEPEPELFEEPTKKGNKVLAESMEDIQVDNLKPKADEQPPLTLNQRLSAQKKESKPVELEAVEPLSDIKAAITLNDKLLFVKDLFKGYNLAYTEAIEIVNRFSSFEEADRFLKNNYVTKNNWEGKKETSDKFYALLRRRYA